MKRLLLSAALAAVCTLSACARITSAGSALVPEAAPAHGAAPSTDFTARLPLNSLGGIPSFKLTVSLYDAPLTFGKKDQINLALLGANLVGKDGLSHPMYTFKHPAIVDLLTLKKQAKLFQTRVLAGTYVGIEFVIQPSLCSVVVDGTRYPVRFGNGAVASTTPLALESPVAIVGTNGSDVRVTVDFNALESVSLSGGVAQIDPHFVASTEEATLHGEVRNRAGKPVVGATVVVEDRHGKVVNTAVTDANGQFVVHALGSGMQTVKVLNQYTSASGVTVSAQGATGTSAQSDVQLAAGVDLDLGTLVD
jgi:hypothetical protein